MPVYSLSQSQMIAEVNIEGKLSIIVRTSRTGFFFLHRAKIHVFYVVGVQINA